MYFSRLCKSIPNFEVINRIARYMHNDFYANVLVPLKSRKLLKVHGVDAPDYLQGLITNDMRHFDDGAKSMYAMFLNSKGRVLYDTLIHKWEGEGSFLIECDRSNFSLLQNHLKMYKLKRKVHIDDVNKEFHLWALISPVNLVPDTKLDTKSPMNIYKDPRLSQLGCRVLTSISLKGSQVIDMLAQDIRLESEDVYKYLRYKLGVGEGPEDLPPGACFPLEANCDYLHGVSFHKGCYVGQELTARTHHTGVIRKRLMPIKFFDDISDFIDKDAGITALDNPKVTIGKLKGFVHDYGLGLVKVKEAIEAKTLKIGESTGEAVKPVWWPIEAPKEKLTAVKND